MRLLHCERIYGDLIDDQTRCVHYNTALDIIAIKFKCCGCWFPCFECHLAAADHPAEVWPIKKFDEKAVLCGSCGSQLTIAEYLDSDNVCPTCAANFNPGCRRHYSFYFEKS